MATCVITITAPVIENVAVSVVGVGAGAGAVALTLVLPTVLMGVGAGLMLGPFVLLVLGPLIRRTSKNQTASRTPFSSTNSPRKSESYWYEPEKDHFYVSQKARNSESIRLTANVIPGETLKTYAELNEILFNQLNENRTGSSGLRTSASYWYEPEKDRFYFSKKARTSESIRLTANVIPGETLKTYDELNEILFNQLNENRTGSPVLRKSDSYWYEPEKDYFYVSKKARNSESIRLTANVIPGETLKTYAELKELLGSQLRDANQSKQDSNPSGECNTPEKRNEKNTNFEKQQPKKSLQDQHWNVPFEFERDPNNQTGQEREDLSTDQFWMSVVTPKNFKYTMVGLANNGREGFLHSLIRHGNEFEGFQSVRFRRDILDVVPPFIRQLINKIRKNSNRDRCNEIEQELLSDLSYPATLQLQKEFRDYIQKIVKHESNFLYRRPNTNGQTQVFWKINEEKVLVICLSEDSYFPVDGSDDVSPGRDIRKIITMFVTSRARVDSMIRADSPFNTHGP